MNNMNIAFITPDYTPNPKGGCGISSSLLVNRLREFGYNVDVFCINYRSKSVTNMNGTDYYFKGMPKIPFLNNFAAYFKLRKKLKSYSIVHVYNMDLIPVAAIIKHKQYKLVATINNPKGAVTSTYSGHIPLVNKISNFLTTKAIKYFKGKVDDYIALTQALKNLYVENGYNRSKITVIPNMYDPKFIKRNNNRGSKKSINLLYSGQLGDNKGVLDLIKAFDIIRKRHNSTYLTILGKGKYEQLISNYLKEYELEEFVTLKYRKYPNIKHEYFSSDILIHPAKWFEPFSRVWLEAMCANLYIVSTNNPSALEILKDKAIFYNSEDKKGLVDAIKKAIISLKNGDIIYQDLNEYSPEIVVKNIVKLYQKKIYNDRSNKKTQ